MFREPKPWSRKHMFLQNMKNDKIFLERHQYVNSIKEIPERPIDIDKVDEWILSHKYNSNKKFIENYLKDTSKEIRLKEQECKTCFYSVYGVFPAFTDTNCGSCGITIHHHNSGVPMLCNTCSKINNACVRCGGSIEYD